ncbi:MAG: hypothetical protein JRI34_02720 [Deltaproteobacteria bacterium]|nr:hypothetical protein [Deltaproteobacteria bacterium]
MRQIYINKWSETVNATHSKYVLSDVVKPGCILHVHNCFAHAPERKVNDIIQMGVRDGVSDVLVRSRGGAIAKEGMTNLNDFFVGEGDLIFAYFPDSDDTNTIELHVIGCLLSIDEYREKGE